MNFLSQDFRKLSSDREKDTTEIMYRGLPRCFAGGQ